MENPTFDHGSHGTNISSKETKHHTEIASYRWKNLTLKMQLYLTKTNLSDY